MNRPPNEIGSRKNPAEKHLERPVINLEPEHRQENFRYCQDVSNESRQLKKMLKQAVEREFAPQRLIDSIKIKIRR